MERWLTRRLTHTLAAGALSLLLIAMTACQGVSTGKAHTSDNGGGPGQLTVSSSSVNFGSIQVGSKLNQSVNLTNLGTTSVTVSAATVSGASFTMGAVGVPMTVAAGQSQTLTMTFTPKAAGPASGTLAVTSNASNGTINVALSGTGTTAPAPSQLSVSPASINFGNQAVGSMQTQTGMLSASNASVTITSAAWSGQGYAVSGITFPFTLAAGTSVNYTVSFTPQTAGGSPGTISFVSDASNSPSTQTWGGNRHPSQHSHRRSVLECQRFRHNRL